MTGAMHRPPARGGLGGERWAGALASLLLLIIAAGAGLLYEPLNHGPARLFLRTALDRGIPLVPVFVIPYLSLIPYVAISLVSLLLLRVRIFRSAAAATITALLVSCACYALLQSYVDRPPLTGTDPLTALVRLVYANDRPYNDFPSLHTSLSTLVAIHWWRVDRRAGLVAAAWSLLIVASTLFIHQHYLADVGGGLVLGMAASALSLRLLAGERELRPRPAG